MADIKDNASYTFENPVTKKEVTKSGLDLKRFCAVYGYEPDDIVKKPEPKSQSKGTKSKEKTD